MHPAPAVPIVLVGLMGAGKTEVGRMLAARLGCRFVDTDATIVADAGKSVAEIFETEGEAGFRGHESCALAKVVAGDPDVVVATGGGIVERDTNLELLAGGLVVWLRADIATLVGRVGSERDRPLLRAGDPAAVLGELSARRTARYEAIADVVVETDDLTIAEVVERVASAVGVAQP